MGLFDKFKKKEEKEEKQENIPLTLNYSDGTVAKINFEGICEVEGKNLCKAHIIYDKPDGTFEGRSFLLEPITQKDANGNDIDATESYYRFMAQKDGSVESQYRYNATKGFFKRQDVSLIENDYIGNLAQNEKGEYYRHYDLDFKRKYDEICRAKKEEERAKKEEFNDKLKSDTYPPTDVTPYIASEEAKVLTEKDYKDVFNNR